MVHVDIQENTLYGRQDKLNRYSLVHLSTLGYRTIATTLTCFIGNGCRMQDVEFQKNPSNGRRDTDDKVQSTYSKIPFIIDPL
jgi:hypothetical protein